MDKFNKKWTLTLDSVPSNVCPWNALIIFCIVTRAFKFIVYRIVMYCNANNKKKSYHTDALFCCTDIKGC